MNATWSRGERKLPSCPRMSSVILVNICTHTHTSTCTQTCTLTNAPPPHLPTPAHANIHNQIHWVWFVHLTPQSCCMTYTEKSVQHYSCGSVCVCVCVCMWVHAYGVYMCVCVHVCACMHSCVCMRACIHTTHMPAYLQAWPRSVSLKTHRSKHVAIHTIIQHTTNHNNSKNKDYLGLTIYLFDRETGEIAVDDEVGELWQVLCPEMFQQVSLGPQAIQQNVETIAATARNNKT